MELADGSLKGGKARLRRLDQQEKFLGTLNLAVPSEHGSKPGQDVHAGRETLLDEGIGQTDGAR